MFVKKFEADSIEEALKAVKLELGPDAIILKTITNNGIKGAFKKKRIEITAAITHESYEKKAHVDKVLNSEQKEVFYQKPAGRVQESINKYVSENKKSPSYGNLGLNKVVNTISKGTSSLAEVSSKTSNLLKNSLDEFLNFEDEQDISQQVDDSYVEQPYVKVKRGNHGKYSEPPASNLTSHQELQTKEDSFVDSKKYIPIDLYNELRQEFKTQQHKIHLLEKKMQELSATSQGSQISSNDSRGLVQLRTTLKTLDISEAIILDIVKKASLELSKEDLESTDTIFEFALEELTDSIYVQSSLAKKLDKDIPVITILLSEVSSGQSSMALKLASQRINSLILDFSNEEISNSNNLFSSQILNLKIEKVKNLSEVISICRKTVDKKQSIIIDLKINPNKLEDIKKFFDSLQRGFSNVEIFTCLSAIHSELYNRKIIARYKEYLNGVIISHIDQCLNFGAIINVHRTFDKIPLISFSTGQVVPDDFEEASAERIMAGLFQF